MLDIHSFIFINDLCAEITNSNGCVPFDTVDDADAVVSTEKRRIYYLPSISLPRNHAKVSFGYIWGGPNDSCIIYYINVICLIFF